MTIDLGAICPRVSKIACGETNPPKGKWVIVARTTGRAKLRCFLHEPSVYWMYDIRYATLYPEKPEVIIPAGHESRIGMKIGSVKAVPT